MISKARYWMGIGKPKNQHSLENLKYLYGVLNKNQIVTENNKDLLIETLRSISEILIWGDQNDSSVFDFFLEKQMITFFLHYMKQKYGRFICVQLLQTLNILFENIRHETSLYFLLSNNHINNIILNKFDFSDEEVMAYYISFLKTLSLKLNSHSIHFFFNERASEFPLYVEAIKFFDHPEAMVRIAVRTLSLNVYRVPVQSMQKFIKEKTADLYFSNLVWLIRNHVLDLDICVKNTIDHTKKSSLIDLIDEYIDHLSYVQDIYTLNNQGLSNCLTQQLVRRLFVPVFLNSLLRKDKFMINDRKPYIQPVLAMFLLSHVFSIITYTPLLNDLCELIFCINDEKIIEQMCTKITSPTFSNELDYLSEPKPLINCLSNLVSDSNRKSMTKHKSRSRSVPHFSDLLINNLDSELTSLQVDPDQASLEHSSQDKIAVLAQKEEDKEEEEVDDLEDNLFESVEQEVEKSEENQSVEITKNITDDEKHRQITSSFGIIFETFLQYLNTTEYDELSSLIALSFLYTVINNPGVPAKFYELLKIKLSKSNELNSNYSEKLMKILIGVLTKSVEPDFKVRLATLELAIRVIKSIVSLNNKSLINDFHLACIEQAREQSTFVLRRQFKTEEMFLDMFEHEYHNLISHQFNFEMLLREWSLLLTPTCTPLSGIEFTRRFPCGDTEKLKHSIRTFFLLRNLCINLTNEIETQLPLTKQEHLVKESDALDLNSSDLIACTVNLKEKKDRRFLVIDPIQFILVEPEVKRIGWGIVKFSDLIQDVEVSPDKEDSRSLNITIKKTPSNLTGKPVIILNSVFTFDDHIRCMAAKQHLVRARDRARRMKLEKIAQLLNLSSASSSNQTNKNFTHASSSSDILSYNLVAGRASMISSAWSQIAQPDKQLANSPMTALTSSPLIRNTTNPSHSASGVNFYKHQISFTSPSLAGSTSSNSTDMGKYVRENSGSASISPFAMTNENEELCCLSSENKLKETLTIGGESIEKQRSIQMIDAQSLLAKSLMSSSEQTVSLIQTSFNESENILTSKIQILPPISNEKRLSGDMSFSLPSLQLTNQKSDTADDPYLKHL